MTPSTETRHHALYLKYRPQSFSDVTGQAPVTLTLKRALAGDRVSHAYLFTGPRGTGKTTTARLLAKGIHCEQRATDGDPCGKCRACLAVADGSALDLIEIDAASNRGIDEIRELRDKVAVAPAAAPRKVYIIDEVHMLTKEAFNALLKTLEEPPEHVTFVLATTEPEKVPQTIISRCQRFDFRPASPAQAAQRLVEVAKTEKLKLDPEAADLVARQARGSFRDALSILDLLAASGSGPVTVKTVRETLGLAGVEHLAALEQALIAADRAAVIEAIRAATDAGVAPDTFRRDLVDLLRRRLRAKIGAERPSAEDESRLAAWDLDRLVAALRSFTEAADLAVDSAVPELPLELAALEVVAGGSQTVNKDKAAASGPPRTRAAASGGSNTQTERGGSPKVPAGQGPAPVLNSGAAPAPASVGANDGPSPQRVPRKADAPGAPRVPKDAQVIWERLLEATKHRYSLSVSLQRTRPKKLEPKTLHLDVTSEFFLKKLEDAGTKQAVEAEVAKLLGRKVSLDLSLAECTDDLFDDVLKTFEDAEVQNG